MDNSDSVSLEQVHNAYGAWRRKYLDFEALGIELGKVAYNELNPGGRTTYTNSSVKEKEFIVARESLQQTWQYSQGIRDQWNSQERKRSEETMLALAKSQKRSAWWVAAATVAIFLATAVQVAIQWQVNH